MGHNPDNVSRHQGFFTSNGGEFPQKLYDWEFDKPLTDFDPLVINLQAEGQDSRSEAVVYLLERVRRAESKVEAYKELFDKLDLHPKRYTVEELRVEFDRYQDNLEDAFSFDYENILFEGWKDCASFLERRT